MKLSRTSIFTIFFSTITFTSCTMAQPIDIQSVDDAVLTQTIAAAQPQTTIVVLDIDNTLLTERIQDDLIGSPSWYAWQQAAIQKHTTDALADNMNDFFPLNSYILRHMQTTSCERGKTAEFVHSLEKQGFTVIAATARDPNVNFATAQQLKKQGIVMQPQSIQLPAGSERILGDQILYTQGILYLQGQDKAVYLKHLLIASHQLTRYKQIIYLDDTLKNLTDFEAIYNQNNPTTTTMINAFHYNQDQWQANYFDKALLDTKHLQQQDQAYLSAYCRYTHEHAPICKDLSKSMH